MPQDDPLDMLLESIEKLVADTKKSIAEKPLPCGSRALSFAIEAGLKPQMAYTVSETARYTGLDVNTLYRERNAGRLKFVLPNGSSKGNRIMVDEVDRWMQEN